MPFTFNGIGTSYCFARGFGDPGDDALECFVIWFMPIIPLKAVHLYGATAAPFGRQYRVVPIRWSLSLVLRVYLRYWMVLPMAAGVAAAFVLTLGWAVTGTLEGFVALFIAGWAVALTCGLGYFVLWQTDGRTRRIRRLLGGHNFGTSDPATLAREVLAGVVPAQEIFGVDSFSSAVPALLEKGDSRTALWAARLAAALEDRATAERLTDQVLRAAEKQPDKVTQG
jgi:hypothetical protein